MPDERPASPLELATQRQASPRGGYRGSKPDDKRRCAGIVKTTGRRCSNWALHGEDLCAGHAKRWTGLAQERAKEAAKARKQARLTVREKAAAALNDDWPQVLAALRRGLEDKDARKAAQVAVSYVQLVYGRQLQQKEDEQPAEAGPLDVAAMTSAERRQWRRAILERRPELAERLELEPEHEAG
jgi:hypothetical protein